jgi:hypothetical protein
LVPGVAIPLARLSAPLRLAGHGSHRGARIRSGVEFGRPMGNKECKDVPIAGRMGILYNTEEELELIRHWLRVYTLSFCHKPIVFHIAAERTRDTFKPSVRSVRDHFGLSPQSTPHNFTSHTQARCRLSRKT